VLIEPKHLARRSTTMGDYECLEKSFQKPLNENVIVMHREVIIDGEGGLVNGLEIV